MTTLTIKRPHGGSKKTPAKSTKVGRRAWTPPDLEQVTQLAARCVSRKAIAQQLGIHEGTLYAKMAALPEFDEAIKKGEALAETLVCNSLMDLARAGNIAALCFIAKCKLGWREVQTIEIVDPRTLTDAELDAAEAAIQRAGIRLLS